MRTTRGQSPLTAEHGQPRRPLNLEFLEPRVLLSAPEAALQPFSASPALFAPNQGQWADASVRFVHSSGGATVALTDSGPVFQLSSVGAASVPRDGVANVAQFSVTFEGARAVTPVGQDPSQAVYNYYVGDPATWRTDVPTFETVAYLGLWDGIDLLTWGRRDGLKYEFHIAPGADPGQIRLRYEGIEGLSLDKSGALHIATALGEVVDDAPVIYQVIGGERVGIAGSFRVLDAATCGFAVTGPYDPQAELVIDPAIAWSSYLGGSDLDAGYGLAVDGSGDVFITGTTFSSNFPSDGGFDTSRSGISDAFLTKVSASGALLWSTFLGGSDYEGGYEVAVDAAGDAFITGETYSGNFPTLNAFQDKRKGNFDAFVTKVSGAGVLLWSSYLGGGDDDAGWAIAVDNMGDAFITGRTASSGFPASGAFDTDYEGGTYDAFVTKVSGAGVLLWSSFLGGSNQDEGRRIAVDAAGDAFVTGRTLSKSFPTPGGFDTSYGGGSSFDAFVTKVSGAGALLWSSFLGGSKDDQGRGIAVDPSGDVFVTGDTASSDFPTLGGFDTSRSGTTDAFLTKVSGGGALLWSSYLGGSKDDTGGSVVTDPLGNVIVAGNTLSSDFPTLVALDTTRGGPQDAFVTKVTGAGTLLWSSYLGGSKEDWVTDIAMDGSGNTFVAGYTASSDFPAPGGFDTTRGGPQDAFVTKIANSPPTLTAIAVLGGGVEETDFALPYAALAAAANEADLDGDAVSFRIEAVSTGTLTKGGVPVVPGVTLLSAGESLVWHPGLNHSGTLPAFTVKAWDGHAASAAAVQVSVVVAPVADVPGFYDSVPSDPSAVLFEQLFAFDFHSTNEGQPGQVYSLVAGPAWLSMNPTTGLLSGTPTQRGDIGSAPVTVRVDDGLGNTDDFTFQLAVQAHVIALGAGLATPLTKARFTDAAGNLVDASVKGGGVFYLVRAVAPDAGGNYHNDTPGDLLFIEGDGTDAKATLSLKVSSPSKAPSPSTTVRDIVVNGSLSLSAPALNLLGDLTVTGGVGKLTLGDVAAPHLLAIGADPLIGSASIVLGRVQDATLTSATPLKSLSVVEWLDTDATPDVITAPWISSLATTGSKTAGGPVGDFEASLALSGLGATKDTLSKASIVGSVVGGVWNVAGAAGSLTVRGDLSNCSFQADWLKSLKVTGAIGEDGSDGDSDVFRVLNGSFSASDMTWKGVIPPDHWFGSLRAFVG